MHLTFNDLLGAGQSLNLRSRTRLFFRASAAKYRHWKLGLSVNVRLDPFEYGSLTAEMSEMEAIPNEAICVSRKQKSNPVLSI
jgi:hypothetical protein